MNKREETLEKLNNKQKSLLEKTKRLVETINKSKQTKTG